MRQRRFRDSIHDTVWLSGWVFADLLLALAVLFLATARGAPVPTPIVASNGTPAALLPVVLCISTEGSGAFIHSQPNASSQIRAWPNGTRMIVLTQDGEWILVRAPDGFEGYVLAKSLSGDCSVAPIATSVVETPVSGTPTLYPTYTFYPTHTPDATYTPYPTPIPTNTPMPTSPSVPPTDTPAPTPTPVVGLSRTPFSAGFRVDPAQVPGLASRDPEAKRLGRKQLRSQVRSCFGNLQGQAGIVLTFGANPDALTGNTLAEELNAILRAVNPSMFRGAVMRNYHTITTDPLKNGTIDVEVYLITRSDSPGSGDLMGAKCAAPPPSCQGSGAVQLMVLNWAGSELLRFVLDGRAYQVESAQGSNPSYLCIRTSKIRHDWSASFGNYNNAGVVDLTGGSQFLYFCLENDTLTPNCSSAGTRPDLRGE